MRTTEDLMALNLEAASYAILDGKLCRLNRRGTVVRRHAPIGGRIEDFLVVQDRIVVREAPEDFLAGVSNLYCLDENFKLVWLAQQPKGNEAYLGPPCIEGTHLFCPNTSGHRVKIKLLDGALQ